MTSYLKDLIPLHITDDIINRQLKIRQCAEIIRSMTLNVDNVLQAEKIKGEICKLLFHLDRFDEPLEETN